LCAIWFLKQRQSLFFPAMQVISPTKTRRAKYLPRRVRSGGRLLSWKLVATATTRRPFKTLVRREAGALVVGPFPVRNINEILALAARYEIPTIYPRRAYVDMGGLMSYSAVYADTFRQAGIYTGRILKGEKPSDLPVVLATKFEFVINLKTAKALDLTIPDNLLAIADEVIE
jgi:putative ABC transport system substrate-binding protein